MGQFSTVRGLPTYWKPSGKDMQVGDGSFSGFALDMSWANENSPLRLFNANVSAELLFYLIGVGNPSIRAGSSDELSLGSNASIDFTIGADGELHIGTGAGDAGASGEVFTSQGAGSAPQWSTVPEGGLGAASVSQGKLKTTTGEVSVASSSSSNEVLPGGTYGFYPQTKCTDSSNAAVSIGCGSSGYQTNIFLDATGAGNTLFAQQRYVQSSGLDFWLFLLRRVSDGSILAAYAAPDHPATNNGRDFTKIPHPFVDHFGSVAPGLEIVAVERADALAAKEAAIAANADSVLEWILQNRAVSAAPKTYVPIDTGAHTLQKVKRTRPSRIKDENGDPITVEYDAFAETPTPLASLPAGVVCKGLTVV